MILKDLKLKNIRSYLDENIVFPEGSVMLAGDIGAGKSTILHAIEFALFGTRRDGLSGDALLRKGEQKGEVELSFEKEGQRISVRRGLKRTKDSVAQESGHIVVDGVRHDLTSTELKARILQLLGYPKELLTRNKSLVYRYTVYTPQEEMKQILFDNPDSRIDTLRKVFGIDKYKRIVQNAQLFTKSLRDDRRVFEAKTQDLPEKEKELSNKREEFFSLEQRADDVSKRLEQKNARKVSKQSEIQAIEKSLEQLHELRQRSGMLDAELREVVRQRRHNIDEISVQEEQVKKLRDKLESMTFEEKEFPEIEDVERLINEKEQRLQKMVSKKTELIERQNHILRRREEVKKDIGSKEKEKEGLAAKKDRLLALQEEIRMKDSVKKILEETEEQLNRFERQVAEIRTKQESSKVIKEKISGLDECPTCRQSVSDGHKEKITQTEDERIQLLETDLQDLAMKKGKALETLEEYRKKYDDIVEQEKRLAAVRAEVEGLERVNEELSKLEKMQSLFDEEKVELLKELESVDDSLIEHLREEIADKKSLLKELNSYLLKQKEHLHLKNLIAEKVTSVSSLKKQNDDLKSRVSEINTQKMSINKEIEAFGRKEKILSEKKSELEKILSEERALEVRLSEFKSRSDEIGKVIKSLEREVSEKKGFVSKMKRINGVLEWLDKMFMNLMGTMERHIMIRIHQQFNELFAEWFDLLIDDENLSVRLDDSFCPVVTQNGHESMVEHLSGGEKTSVALAYRLALNKVVNNIVQEVKTKDLIILDEPTDGFSTEQLDKVREVLDRLDMRQVIIVSHENKVESFVDNVIRVHKREHESRVL